MILPFENSSPVARKQYQSRHMTNSTTYSAHKPQNGEIWSNLKQAIANSSGFQNWQQARDTDPRENLDTQVRRYLEETLATLAY